MKHIRNIGFLCVALCMLTLSFITVFAENIDKTKADIIVPAEFTVDAKSAVLMEAKTGEVLFSQNEHEALPPASVTKIMTLLLVMEAIDSGRTALTDTVSISANAASMGGSQVFLEEGERMTVEDLLKCTVIASANDAAVALAEHVAGSEAAFVSAMNARARELGLSSTVFENTTGLDDTVTRHVTSAYDIAIMTKELLSHDTILKYSSLWQDTIRDGAFTLTNTNRLVRYYDGCNGMKTGSTDAAGFCVSATAERDGMTLIAVVMGADTRDSRNAIAKNLLDYGFSTYALYDCSTAEVDTTPVLGGVSPKVRLTCPSFCRVIPKGSIGRVEEVYELPEFLRAPVKIGDIVGKKTYLLDGKVIGECPVTAAEDVEKISLLDIFVRFLTAMFCET